MTLLAALLLERRVILVAEDRGKVSAAVHAAAALLYPFRWQHIYLPLLPIALKVRHCQWHVKRDQNHTWVSHLRHLSCVPCYFETMFVQVHVSRRECIAEPSCSLGCND